MLMSISPMVRLDDVSKKILKAAREVELLKGSEEDLKVRIESILEQHVWSKLGVPKPRYEYLVDTGTYVRSYGRIDALYGLTIFEYKKPGVLKTKERDKAIRKLKEEYIPGLLREKWVKGLISKAKERKLSPRIIGIIFDGYRAIFVEYHIETGVYVIDPPVGFYDLSSEKGVEYLRRIIRSVVASYRKKLDAKILASDFGYMSEVAKDVVKTFYYKLVNPSSEKTKALFDEWFRTISQAYPISGEELRRIAELYGFKDKELEEVDGVKLFYAIQTYYSLILKLLAAEVAARFHDSAASMYIKKLMEASKDPRSLYRELEFLESGMIYTWYGIRNFLEGEFFSWYLCEWDREVFEVIRSIIERLDEYDVEALTLDLSTARDMFKLLYEELVPRKEVRQKLGIYSTPDWLAELILNELGLSIEKMVDMKKKGVDPLDLRILDPGAGTGTFLSLIIQRLAEYLRKYYGLISSRIANEALKKITKNIVGFDIDALAVLTARTNYLIALAVAGLLEHKGGETIEIPIYLTNSIITAEEQRDKVMVPIEDKPELVEVAKVPTVVGGFQIPLRMIKDGSILEVLTELKSCIEHEYSSGHKSVLEILRKYSLSKAETFIIKDLYNKLLELKRKGIDEVWIPLIKSHIIPILFKQSFDFIVGNPPWLAFRYIANPDYQNMVKDLIKNTYGLVRDEHLMTQMEMATLFFARSIDLYLKDGGSIGFVMPRAIFSADQHDVFRRGKSLNAKYEIIKIIDCEGVEPLFYVPACAVIAKKSGKIKYPVSAVIVKGKLPEDKHKVISLSEAIEKHLKLTKSELYLGIIGSRSFLDYKKIELYGKRSDYYRNFYQGATIVPQPCWFVDIIDTSDPRFVIVQTARRAKVRGKVKEEIGPLPVEREFIYGVLTSAEVLPFCHLPPNIAVLPIKPTSNGYEIIRKEKAKLLDYPHLLKWLEETEKIWNKVRGKKKVDLYEWLNYQHKLTRQNPNIKYKVVYLRSGTHLASCIVINELKTVNECNLNGILIESTLYWFGTNNYEEAYFLTAIFNSSVLDDLIKPLQSRGEFGERDIHKKPLEFPIPRFNPDNPIHRRLAELGKKATEEACKILSDILVKFGYNKKLRERGCLVPTEVARLRQAIREHLKDILREIDELTWQVLTEYARISRITNDLSDTGKNESKHQISESHSTLDKWLSRR